LFTFQRPKRLLVKEDFNYVFNRAKRIGTPALTVLYRSNVPNHARLGFVIAKKSLKKAVDRNRYKRIIRESFRLNQANLPAVDIVILAKRDAKQFDKQQVRQQIDQVWQKLIKYHSK
jgi:ribonuclease P protein component